jgi:hypothetical protein
MPYISAQILGVIVHYLLESRMDIWNKKDKREIDDFFIEKEKSKIERRSVVMPLDKEWASPHLLSCPIQRAHPPRKSCPPCLRISINAAAGRTTGSWLFAAPPSTVPSLFAMWKPTKLHANIASSSLPLPHHLLCLCLLACTIQYTASIWKISKDLKIS